MSDYTAARIEKPPYFRIAPLVRGRGSRKVQVIGFDTEADHGRPFLVQLSSSGGPEDTQLVRLDERPFAALGALMTYLARECRRRDTEYLVVGWNLAYEWTQLFGDLPERMRALGEYEFDYELRDGDTDRRLGRWSIKVMADRRYFAVITDPTSKVRVRILDGMAWYVTSLDKAAAMLGLGRKVELGEGRRAAISRADLDDPRFLEYARQDAYLTRRIGEAIVELHERYDVPTTVSAPHFAARVFRRHFLGAELPLAPPALEQAGLWAYHGGKNGYYADRPQLVRHVWSIDITSAYPEAMRALPDPVRSRWVAVTEYTPGLHAIWHVAGVHRPCTYSCGLTVEGRKLPAGAFETWTTGYELDAAVQLGEVDLTAVEGWVFDGPSGGALTEYVDQVFAEKRRSTGAAREAAKLLLNSLYGKFFQKVALGEVGAWVLDLDDELAPPVRVTSNADEDFDYRAGGLYHPPIAALITGFVRARMHRLEHYCRAIMTSTDGLFGYRKPPAALVGSDLGQLTVERGTLQVWRERLYAFTADAPGAKAKYALHGFRGSLDELRGIPLAIGRYEYRARQMITNRLSLRALRGTVYAAGTFADLTFTLDLSFAEGP